MAPNPGFVAQTKAAFPDPSSVLIGCKSGRRSANAAALLDGYFSEIVDVGGGFDAWLAAGLPVSK